MPIYQTGGYQVKPSAVSKVKQAIREFVAYVQANEPGTLMYHRLHRTSEAIHDSTACFGCR